MSLYWHKIDLQTLLISTALRGKKNRLGYGRSNSKNDYQKLLISSLWYCSIPIALQVTKLQSQLDVVIAIVVVGYGPIRTTNKTKWDIIPSEGAWFDSLLHIICLSIGWQLISYFPTRWKGLLVQLCDPQKPWLFVWMLCRYLPTYLPTITNNDADRSLRFGQ